MDQSRKIFNLINQLHTDTFKIIINFLEIQEYMSMIPLSKIINAKLKIYKKIKKPYLIVYNTTYGGYSISSKCGDEMKRIKDLKEIIFIQSRKFEEISYLHRSRCNQYLIQAILNLGSEETSGKYANLGFYVVPWIFRNSFIINEYDGLENVQIDYNRYRYNKLEKYKNKVDQYKDDESKEIYESKLFKKLLLKHQFLIKHELDDDKYMDLFCERINKLIYED